MERCFFNSCILNDNDYLKKYKKCFPDNKRMFESINKEDNMIDSLSIPNGPNKYIFCSEHYNNLKDLLNIKKTIISNPDNIPKDTLVLLNKILKNNLDIKKLLYKLTFQRNSNIIKILAKNLSLTQNKDNKLYLLLNMNHFLKENLTNVIDKNYSDEFEDPNLDNEIFGILFREINDLKLMVYDLSQNKVNPLINDENYFRDVILYNLCLTNIDCLFNNWDKKKAALDLQKTKDLIQKISDIFRQVVLAYNSIPNKTICNELFYHIIGLINTYLISNLKNFDLVVDLINLFVKTGEHIYDFLNAIKMEIKYKSTIKNYISTLNSILDNMRGISLNEIDKEYLNNFIENTKKFNEDKKSELLYYKNQGMIEEIKEKMKMNLAQQNMPKNIDEE